MGFKLKILLVEKYIKNVPSRSIVEIMLKNNENIFDTLNNMYILHQWVRLLIQDY